MHIVSLRAKVAVVGGIAMLAIGLLPLATGVDAVVATVTPFTGGLNIQSNTARIGGSGAWRTLTGPTTGRKPSAGGRWATGSPSGCRPTSSGTRRARPRPVSRSCDKVASHIVYSSSNTVATVTIQQRSGASQFALCTLSFNTLLQVRPVSNSMAAGSGGTVALTFVHPATPTPQVFPGGAGHVTMVQSPTPTPTPTPTPAGAPSVIPATGGTGIASNTALTGGSGAWTTLSGPTITEGGIGAWPIGTRITLVLPANFQWNQANATAPSVSGCDRTINSIVYSGNDTLSVTLVARSGASQLSVCTIAFGNTLQVRPLNSASSAGTGGMISLTFVDPTLPMPSVFPGGAGQVSLVTSTPPVSSRASLRPRPT